KHLSTHHTLLVPEVSPDTLLYFATQRQKHLPMVMQVAVRETRRSATVPLTLIKLNASAGLRRWNTAVLATWRAEDLAQADCHSTEQLAATNPISLTQLTWPTTGELTQGYWYAHRGVDFADSRGSRCARLARARW
ncbi:MAG: hypothetical protein HC853_11795, partial [Anaerolineae bacterium]|nr:hypothetical protein [Anaerolineae bacterium]